MNRKYFQQRNEFAVKLIRELYRCIDGRELSLQGRKKNSIDDHQSLTYGEIVPQSFIQILSTIVLLTPQSSASASCSLSNKVFVDLGCGVGVAVITAALSSFYFSKVWGIELLPELAEAAISVPVLLTNYLQQSRLEIGHSNPKGDSSDSKSGREDLHQVIEKVFIEFNLRTMSLENLVDLICKKVGHKEYKKLLKGSKSFKKFLTSHPTLYQVEGEEVTISNFDSINSQNNEVDEAGESDSTPHPRRQTRPDVILSLLKTPVGQTLGNEGGLPDILFECNDIFEVNWWDEADVVYCASLLFSDEMMSRLLELVWRMKPNTFFISLKPFTTQHQSHQGDVVSLLENANGRQLRLVSDSFYRMSWQMARVYIYQLSPQLENQERKSSHDI